MKLPLILLHQARLLFAHIAAGCRPAMDGHHRLGSAKRESDSRPKKEWRMETSYMKERSAQSYAAVRVGTEGLRRARTVRLGESVSEL